MGASGAMMAASAASSAAGAYSQSQAQKSSLNYQASIAANNAQISQDQATVALNNGQTQAQTQDLKTAAIFGAQRAQLAANGVDLGSGSPNDLLATTKYMGNRDHATVVDNAMRQAWGYQVQGADQLANSRALSTMSDNISPTMSAATSLLGSASQVSSAWNTYAKANGQPNADQMISNGFNSATQTVKGWFN